MKTLLRSTAVLGLLVTTSIVLAQGRRGAAPPEPSLMTYEQAATAMAAAEAYTNDKGWAMTIRIVDQNNNLIMMHRLNNVNPFTVGIVEQKTLTVVGSKMTSAEYGQKVGAGEIEAIEGAVTFGGGVPVYLNGQFIGAIAASGGRPEEDEEVARAGVEAIGARTSM
jgi:glc operon protein GlcG